MKAARGFQFAGFIDAFDVLLSVKILTGGFFLLELI